MILLTVALASAGACDPAAALAALETSGARDDYMCVIQAENGKDLVLAELLKDPTGKNERRTRALALWLLQHTDRPMDPDVVDKLSPSDRRLLADGIRARRGRASPAPEHAKVFEQFGWYEPVPNYTDARLRPIDRENLAVVDPPVRLTPAPAPADPAKPEGKTGGPPPPGGPPGDVTAETPNLCGCAGSGRGAGVGGIVLAGLLVARLRRRA